MSKKSRNKGERPEMEPDAVQMANEELRAKLTSIQIEFQQEKSKVGGVRAPGAPWRRGRCEFAGGGHPRLGLGVGTRPLSLSLPLGKMGITSVVVPRGFQSWPPPFSL